LIFFSNTNSVMNAFLLDLSNKLEELTGIKGALGYIVIIICAMVGNAMFNTFTAPAQDPSDSVKEEEEEEEPDPQRNFTIKQLKHFDGTHDEKMKEDKPVYLSLAGTVFNATAGKDFYGPGGPYSLFAGRECGMALAKMSFDETYLNNVAGCADLNFGERDSLDGWIQQFTHFKCYPILGKLVPDDQVPSSDRVITKEELEKNNGSGEVPDGYATAPIFIGAGGHAYDASFGGVTFYGKGCSYNRFAGVDASRALAKMSFDTKDVEDPDCTNLTDKEKKILNDWIKTFKERKGYPCVGKLES